MACLSGFLFLSEGEQCQELGVGSKAVILEVTVVQLVVLAALAEEFEDK